MAAPAGPAELEARLNTLVSRAQGLETEGLSFPTAQIQGAFREALVQRDLDRATTVLKRGEAILSKATQDWTWVSELLRRADELRSLATSLGVDVAHLDSRVGNAREQLRSAPLSAGSLEKAAASASLALAVLSDAIPKFCVQEAQRLGGTIRSARDRGEDVTESTRALSSLMQAIQEEHLPVTAARLIQARQAVGRIPRAPAVATIPDEEEEEILMEARNLARRLHRIKGKAHDAQSAARLMTQVRAALSEDRRFGTPEEEIEELWTEVDRITRERAEAAVSAPVVEVPVAVPVEAEPEAPPPPEPARSSRARAARTARP
ncbi:MAG: hypothetical protein L3K19_07790 [Thermoplasmata archaeon]|nr:hypothetical protein [Thermoplasmata archaeon]